MTRRKTQLHSQHISILIAPHSPQTEPALARHSATAEEKRNLTSCLILREKGNDSPVTSFITLQPLFSPRKSLLIYCIERRIKLSLFHCKAMSPPKSRAVHLTGTQILPLPGDYVSTNIPKTLRSIVPSVSYYSLDHTKN